MRIDRQPSAAFNAALLKLLSDLDPYGLEPGTTDGAPADEYSLEAAAMASHLVDHGQISPADIDVIWVYWFSERLSTGNENRLARFVADLNALIASASWEDPATPPPASVA